MAVAERNGTVERSTVPSLRTLTPERKTLEIDGQEYSAWVVTNGRYPNSVRAELDAARLEWLAAYNARNEFDPLEWEAYVKRCLLAVVPGLDYDTADLLPLEDRNQLLVDLGVFRPVEQPEGAESTNPPAAVADSPGSTLPPTSAPITGLNSQDS